jgi:hypothetical protein
MTIQRRNEILNVPLAKCILKDFSNQLHEADKTNLERVLRNRRRWKLEPIYRQGGYDLNGRNWCEKGLCMFSRKLRNTLAFQFYKDIDMVNAGYTWLYSLLERYEDLKKKKECKWIINYYKKREKVIQKFIIEESASREEAKKFFISKLFDGREPIINEIMKRELKIYPKAREFYESIQNEPNPKGRTMCYMYGIWEFQTLQNIIMYFEKERIECFADLHDGFFIKKNEDEDSVNLCIDEVHKKFGVKLVVKEMKDFLDIPREYIEDYKEAIFKNEQEKYKYLKEKFEELYGVCKIIQQGMFMLELGTETSFKTQSDLIFCFNDWKEAGTETFSLFGEEKRFIHNYVLDPDKKVYDRIDFYPKPELCPDNVYNLFDGFHITNMEGCELCEEDYQDFEEIKKHIYFITDDFSNQATACAEYLLDWIAHIFQYPHLKTFTMIILKGGEGVGKSLLVHKIGYMLGKKYYYSTENPQQHLFGTFNSIGKSRLLINMDEGEKSQTTMFYEQLKNNITEEENTCSAKYEKNTIVKNHSRYFMTTNNEGVIKIGDTNRRFVGFECRHKRKDPTKMLKAFNNDRALYLFYKFLMNRDIKNKKWDDFPKTNYYRRCLDLSIPFIYNFLNEFISGLPLLKNYKQIYKMIPTKTLFELYEAYATEYRVKPLLRKEFVNQLEATAILTQRDGGNGKFMYFKEDELKAKLKDIGLYQDTIFLE